MIADDRSLRQQLLDDLLVERFTKVPRRPYGIPMPASDEAVLAETLSEVETARNARMLDRELLVAGGALADEGPTPPDQLRVVGGP